MTIKSLIYWWCFLIWYFELWHLTKDLSVGIVCICVQKTKNCKLASCFCLTATKECAVWTFSGNAAPLKLFEKNDDVMMPLDINLVSYPKGKHAFLCILMRTIRLWLHLLGHNSASGCHVVCRMIFTLTAEKWLI